MCGLFYSSIIKLNPLLIKEILKNRGSDDYNFQYLNNGYIAHSRLIFSGDKLDGIQPVDIKNKNSILLFNGEIYSFNNKLTNEYHKSDTAVLSDLLSLNNFNEVIKQLDGMYSIVFIHKDGKTIQVARDYYGQKPLYYGFFKDEIVISSSSYLCAKYLSDSVNFSSDGIKQYLAFGFIAKESIYENVFEVPPGTIMTFKNGVLFQEKIEYKNYTLNTLDMSIEKCINSSNSTALALSSGVDSMAIASYYYKLKKKPDLAITIASNDKEFDESEKVKELNKQLKFPIIILKPTIEEIHDAELRLMKILDEPISDSGLVPNLLVAESAKNNGIKILITGDGGDELFGGYNRHALFSWIINNKYKALILDKIISNLPKKIIMNILGYTRYGSGALDIRLNIMESAIKSSSLLEFYIIALSGLSINNNVVKSLLNILNKDNKNSNFKNLLELDQKIYLKGNNLYRSDRISLASGVESRAPFLNNILQSYLNINKYNGKKDLINYINFNGVNYSRNKKMGFSINKNNIASSDDISEVINFIKNNSTLNLDDFKDSPYFNNRIYYLSKWLKQRQILN